MLRPLLGLAAVALAAGCVTPLGTSADRVRAGLIGLRARQLATCLPDPLQVDPDGSRERLTYAWRSAAVEISRDVVVLDDLTRPHGARSARLEWERDGFCAFRFTVEDGAVTGVEVVGRSAAGLEASAECIFSIRHCVAPR